MSSILDIEGVISARVTVSKGWRERSGPYPSCNTTVDFVQTGVCINSTVCVDDVSDTC